MNGDLQSSAVQVLYTGTEITFKALREIIKKLLENKNKPQYGQQSLKKLNIQGRQLESINLPNEDIQLFKRELKRYNVDFSVMKDKKADKRYIIFFKGQDVDRVYKGLESCVRGLDQTQAGKPINQRIQEAIQKYKDKDISKNVKERQREKSRGSREGR